MILTRRRLLGFAPLILAAPAIVRASSIMKVRAPKFSDLELPFTTTAEEAQQLAGAFLLPPDFARQARRIIFARRDGLRFQDLFRYGLTEGPTP